ncbi:YopX family protein [Lysinibacillus fusiformis]|uniref:YopX family protein n=1 Tax=Lysinibacillus fusiformis TaxID=28031 RepID=UPI000D3A789A|nr:MULTISPECIES: YopX family protein [Lysinibacillus]MED4668052.1 YopX family protein [Lysinibacillus fusiformis]QAS58462.1 hypothetical protein LSP_20140 [Lysinibacillus sphaericus]RDV35540.1 hypothetical protein C7B90_02975 [Lysinibacillus fusiformis]GED64328.1 phage protein [Lysinibacillus fusiformis]
MREIKFRAWMENKMLSHEDLVDMDQESYAMYTILTEPQEDITFMQLTGLKDKNGKEIYEGDIVEYNDFNSLRTGGHAEDKIIVGKVVFSCGMWMVEENNCGHDLYEGLVNDEELEIIGNIYENPELLEGTA